MTLHSEIAEQLHYALSGKPAQVPNGSTPEAEREIVRQVLAVEEIGARLGIYNRMLYTRPDKGEIDKQVFEFKPMGGELVPFIGKEKEKTFKSADYVRVLNQLGFEFRLCTLDDQIQVNGKPLTDVIESKINSFAFDVGLYKTRVMRDAYITDAARHEHNPVKDYLQGLQWDGTDWITTVSTLIADEYDLIETLLRRWAVGAVARVFEHAQNRMLVLDGKQNIGKSFFAAWLGSPLNEHFVEGGINPDDKDHIIRLSNTWIWEVSEMCSTMRRADVEALKSFLTMRDVKVRHPYGHFPITKPAITSFVGTVNNIGGVLNDATGNRRFMATNLVSIDFDYPRVNINQFWAQAVAMYRAGEPWQPTPAELLRIDAVNAQYEVENPVEDLLFKHFNIQASNTEWFTPTLEIIAVLHMNGWRGSTPTADGMIVATACKRIGLKKAYTERNGSTARGYLGIEKKIQPSDPPTFSQEK
jgi:hypothetical protein